MRTKPKYRHIKLPLRTIVREPHHVLIIEDAVQRVNRLVVKAYQLVRLWSLQMIENGSWRRMIDEGKNPIEKKHFRTAFRVIRSDSIIPPRGDENSEAESRLKLLREFQDLFEAFCIVAIFFRNEFIDLDICVLGNFSYFRKMLDLKATTIFQNVPPIFQWIALPRMHHGIHWSDSSNTVRIFPEVFRHVQQN